MDLLITGTTGFAGSHLTLRWLSSRPSARVGCLVRAADAAVGLLRLQAALSKAAADEGSVTDNFLERVDALPGDLDDPDWVGRAESWMQRPAELIHCAANLSFREADRPAVWRNNVEGTAAVLDALPRLRGITAFNYVSPAYVAGDGEGEILEDEHVRPEHFNNPNEYSKWATEGLVRDVCSTSGTAWRIMRPAMVIGHSKTHRQTSQSGFYQVVGDIAQTRSATADRGERAGPAALR